MVDNIPEVFQKPFTGDGQLNLGGLLGLAPNTEGELVPHGNKNFKWGASRKETD